MKQPIADILGIDNTPDWDIFDFDQSANLYLVHYNTNADMNKYGHIRGLVVDTNNKMIVCQSFGYTPSYVSSHIEGDGDHPEHIFFTCPDESQVHVNHQSIRIGYEGTIMRVFKHNGKVYHSTHRRLDSSKSRWGKSVSFMEMYNQLNGPKDTDLFSPEVEYSPYCYIFIMVHPDVLNVCKLNVGKGYLVYLGVNTMWDPSHPYNGQEGIRTFPVSHQVETSSVPVTISSSDITLEQANKHLKYGFHDEGTTHVDPRVGNGEFIIIYEQGTNKLIRVNSPAYQWRLQMRDNNPNLLNRFYQLIDDSYIRTETEEGQVQYQNKFPIFDGIDVNAIRQSIPLITPSVSSSFWIKNQVDRLTNIWYCFLLSVPLHCQIQVTDMLDNFYKSQENIIKWLIRINNTNRNLTNLNLSRRCLQIIEHARQYGQRIVTQNKNRYYHGHKLSCRDLTIRSIRNIIKHEKGASLYKIYTEMIRNHE